MERDDVFGRDPQVVYLRRVFSTVEKMQKELLGKLGISETDGRLGELRRVALIHFERLLPLAMSKCIVNSEEDAGILYLHCLSRALLTKNIAVSSLIEIPNDKISFFIKEVLG